jgi:hypothetical protein
MATKIGTLNVPDAHLYYEVRGSGPVLAVVFPGDHGSFGSHAAEFATKLREVLER